MAEALDVTPAGILAFWRDAGPDRWYRRDDAFDAEVRRRFLRPVAAARQPANYRHGKTSDDGALALVIVLDQFPRNMFRDDARTYASDALAREVAAPRHRSRRRRADRSRLARIPLSAVHAFGASGRPVALHRAVARGTAMPKTRNGPSTTPISSGGSAAFPTATACWAARPRRTSRPSWTKGAFRRLMTEA